MLTMTEIVKNSRSAHSFKGLMNNKSRIPKIFYVFMRLGESAGDAQKR